MCVCVFVYIYVYMREARGKQAWRREAAERDVV